MCDPIIGQYDYICQTVAAVPYIEEHGLFFNFNDTFMSQLSDAHKSCGYADCLAQYMTFPPTGV
jgi:hypothetical protein